MSRLSEHACGRADEDEPHPLHLARLADERHDRWEVWDERGQQWLALDPGTGELTVDGRGRLAELRTFEVQLRTHLGGALAARSERAQLAAVWAAGEIGVRLCRIHALDAPSIDDMPPPYAELLRRAVTRLDGVHRSRVFAAVASDPEPDLDDARELLRREAWATLDALVRQRGIDTEGAA